LMSKEALLARTGNWRTPNVAERVAVQASARKPYLALNAVNYKVVSIR
jgi:hypothetical protein